MIDVRINFKFLKAILTFSINLFIPAEIYHRIYIWCSQHRNQSYFLSPMNEIKTSKNRLKTQALRLKMFISSMIISRVKNYLP